MAIKICFFAMICIVLSSIIKNLRPDMTPFLRVGATLLIGTFAASVITPILTYISSLFSGAGFGEWGSAVLKALGVALIAQISADICRDCGESSAASGVEIAAKLEIVILCLPMFESILKTASEVLSW